MTTEYYFNMAADGTVDWLARIVRGPEYLETERYLESVGKWIKDPDVYGGITGLSSDCSDYRHITDAEAEKYMKANSPV